MTLRNTIDGSYATLDTLSNVCCPPNILDMCNCCDASQFVSLLPSGPLWDDQKLIAIEWFKNSCDNTVVDVPQLECPHIVYHALYVGAKLDYILRNSLWPVLREASPDTAYTTLDYWLERLGWKSCYDNICLCDVPMSNELSLALKKAIIRSVSRLELLAVPNLSSMNFILEPLRVTIAPTPVQQCVSFAGNMLDEEDDCTEIKFTLTSIDNTLETAINRDMCTPYVPSYVDCCLTGCTVPPSLGPTVCLNLITAECIIKSVLPNCVTTTITY